MDDFNFKGKTIEEIKDICNNMKVRTTWKDPYPSYFHQIVQKLKSKIKHLHSKSKIQIIEPEYEKLPNGKFLYIKDGYIYFEDKDRLSISLNRITDSKMHILENKIQDLDKEIKKQIILLSNLYTSRRSLKKELDNLKYSKL